MILKLTVVTAVDQAREERVVRMRFSLGLNTDNMLEQLDQLSSVTCIRTTEPKALQNLKHTSRPLNG